MKKTDINKFRKKTERNNKIAKSIISTSGYAIIISIIAIFLFLLYKIIPLVSGASVEELLTFESSSSANKIKLRKQGDIRHVKNIWVKAGRATVCESFMFL